MKQRWGLHCDAVSGVAGSLSGIEFMLKFQQVNAEFASNVILCCEIITSSLKRNDKFQKLATNPQKYYQTQVATKELEIPTNLCWNFNKLMLKLQHCSLLMKTLLFRDQNEVLTHRKVSNDVIKIFFSLKLLPGYIPAPPLYPSCFCLGKNASIWTFTYLKSL